MANTTTAKKRCKGLCHHKQGAPLDCALPLHHGGPCECWHCAKERTETPAADVAPARAHVPPTLPLPPPTLPLPGHMVTVDMHRVNGEEHPRHAPGVLLALHDDAAEILVMQGAPHPVILRVMVPNGFWSR